MNKIVTLWKCPERGCPETDEQTFAQLANDGAPRCRKHCIAMEVVGEKARDEAGELPTDKQFEALLLKLASTGAAMPKPGTVLGDAFARLMHPPAVEDLKTAEKYQDLVYGMCNELYEAWAVAEEIYFDAAQHQTPAPHVSFPLRLLEAQRAHLLGWADVMKTKFIHDQAAEMFNVHKAVLKKIIGKGYLLQTDGHDFIISRRFYRDWLADKSSLMGTNEKTSDCPIKATALTGLRIKDIPALEHALAAGECKVQGWSEDKTNGWSEDKDNIPPSNYDYAIAFAREVLARLQTERDSKK